MDQLTNFGPLAALIRLWNQLSPAQRVVVTAFAALSAVLLVFVGMAVSKPRMAVMFSGLGREDAGAIAQKLSEAKTPYRLSADGTTIEVPENKVYDLRLEMATQGLPQGGSVGFELFDKTNFGMTEFTEKLNFQRAIQGELTRTICQLAPVMAARVHLAMPEQNVYASDQEPTTASVVLKLRRGMPLTDEQVGGIVHLVSSAVEGLKPNNVTVVDSDGNVLSEGPVMASTGGGLMTSNQTKLKKQYEAELAQNLQSMLAKTVGADKAVVRVSADLSFDQKQEKVESYLPTGNTPEGALPGTPVASAAEAKGVLMSEEKTTETYRGGVMPPGGQIPTINSRGGGANDAYERSQSTAQYGVTRSVTETVSAPGRVERLSVAVLVDEKVDPAKIGVIKEAISSASGINEKRGDQITVERIAFDNMSQRKAAAEMASSAKTEMIMTVAKNAGAVILLLAFLFFLRRMITQIKVPAPAPRPAPQRQPEQNRMPNPADMFAGMEPSGHSEPPAESAQNFRAAVNDNKLPQEIEQSNPEDLARLVRTWMSDQ